MMSCMKACCACCYPEKKEQPDKYPHIEYKSPEQAAVASETHKVPLQKVFEFQQPKTEYALHPQIASQVVYEQPRSMPLPSPDSSERSVITARSTSMSPYNMDTNPTLQFSLYYDIQRRMLTVHLQTAYNLPGKSRHGSCDPFVVMFMQPNKLEIFESKIINKTLNPNFDQIFEFTSLLPQEVRLQTLVFRVYDHDRFSKNVLIGVVALPLEEADLYGVTVKLRIDEGVEKLTESKGDLLFSLRFKKQTGTLQGIILKASNLQKHHITGTADPYVKVYLLYQGKRQERWKSSIKKSTLLPIFNEAFQFEISSIDVHCRIQDFSLVIQVMDHDRFSKDEIVGVVRVGSHVEEEAGRLHWEEVVSSHDQSVSRWHTIMSVNEKEKVKSGSL